MLMLKMRLPELLSLTIKGVTVKGKAAVEAQWAEVFKPERKTAQTLDELSLFGAWQFLLADGQRKTLQEATRKALKSENAGRRTGIVEAKAKPSKKKKEVVEHNVDDLLA